MGGSKQPSKTTSTTTTQVKLPEWVDKASQENYRFAQSVANKPLVQYEGQTVADIPQDQLDAWAAYLGSAGVGMPGYEASSSALQNILGGGMKVTPGVVSPMNFTDVDIQKYMNPYLSQVEDAAFSNIDRATALELMGNADKGVAASAFGGDRGAIVDALTRSEAIRNKGQLSADIRRSGFDTAAGLATGDISRQLQAALANQQAGLTADQANIKSVLDASSGIIGSSDAMRKARAENPAGGELIGGKQRSYEQELLDEQRGKFEEVRDYDLQRLNILLSSLGMSPYGKTESGKTVTKGTPASSGPDWLGAGLGVLSLFGGLFSDRTAKKDIEKLGTDDRTGLDIYAYRYKGEKGGPKSVGPMAQDVEKRFPGSTVKVGGKMVIKPEAVRGILAA